MGDRVRSSVFQKGWKYDDQVAREKGMLGRIQDNLDDMVVVFKLQHVRMRQTR